MTDPGTPRDPGMPDSGTPETEQAAVESANTGQTGTGQMGTEQTGTGQTHTGQPGTEHADSGMPHPDQPDREASETAEAAPSSKKRRSARPTRPSKPSRPPRTPVTARGAALASARVVAGAVGVGIGIVAVVVAIVVPLPSIQSAPASVTVTPVPTAQQLVCAGSLLRLGNASGEDATTATSLGGADVAYAATVGEASTTVLENSNGSPRIVSVPPAETGEVALVAGSQSQALSNSDFAGYAAADCAAASTDAWLVGGSTTTGRTTLLTLANPSDVQSTVAISIFDESGKVDAPGSTGIIVPARGQRVLSLAGFAPETATPVVHVTSKGGQIVANLQQSISRGLEPGGVDIVGSTAAPATTQVIPGLVVSSAVAVEQRLGQDDSSDFRSVLRILVPGDKSTDATITVSPEAGEEPGTSFDIALKPGVVTEVPIEGLDNGRYSITATTDEPIVAGLRVSTAAGGTPAAGSTDFAWLAAPTELESSAVFSAPVGPHPFLNLANDGTAPVDVTLGVLGGDETVITVPAGGATYEMLAAGSSYRLDSPEPVRAVVSYNGTGQLAAFPVREPLSTSGAITIYP